MGQALSNKWRPQTFDDVVGQEHIVQTLRYALQTGHIHHAYLLAGPRGTGKTTTARLIAKAVNCLAPAKERPCNQCEICQAIGAGRLMDLIEIDAASHTGVDNIRDLLEKVGFRPTQATYKVYVIDEVHMLSTAAFNALLKTLEEPPEHVIFVLATTEVHKIPETILSRCQRFEFRRIPLEALIGRLTAIAESEEIEAERQALEIIARAATGSMRDAISLFDQMAANGTITADYARTLLGAERREVVQSLLKAWIDKDLTTGLQIINDAIDSGADPRQLARQTADFLRGLLLMRLGAGHTWTDPTAEERQALGALASQAEPDHLVKAVRLFSEVASKQRTGWQPQLPLELAFVTASLQATQSPVGAQPSAATPLRMASQPATSAPRQTGSSQPPITNRTAPAKRRQSTPAERPAVAETATEPDADTKTGTAPKKSRGQKVTSARVPATNVSSPESQSADTAAPGTTGLDPALVETIQRSWRDLVSGIKPVNVGALLRDATVAGADGEGRLVLAFQHAFHRGKISEAATQRQVEETLTATYRRPIRIRCLMQEDWQNQAPHATELGSQSPEPPNPLEEDELIRRAQEELGAVARINE